MLKLSIIISVYPILMVLIYSTSEVKGREFVSDNALLVTVALVSYVLTVATYVFIRRRIKAGKVSEAQMNRFRKNFYTKNDKNRLAIFILLLIVSAFIRVAFDWFYAMPLIILAGLVYYPVIKKIFYAYYSHDNKKRD